MRPNNVHNSTSRPHSGLILLFFAALAMLHTWPLITDPVHLSRLDNNDTAFNAWVIAWVAHQLPRDPLSLFQAPIFQPESNALAYSEHMTVPAIMGMPLFWLGASPVLVYNLLVLVGNTLSAFAMCRLLVRWTGSTAAGIVAGALFGFNAHMLTRFPHLQAQHVEFIPVALYALDRLLEEPRAKYAAFLSAAFILQALCANYTMVLLTFALCAALAVRSELWGPRAREVWRWLALAGVVAAVVLAPFLWPYYRVRNEAGLVRTIDDVRMYSAGWSDYLATAGRLHYQAWSHQFFANRTALFPGITAVLLSLIALGTGVAIRDRRARMALAFGVMGVALSFGASLPGYEWLHNHVPLMQGMRAAARWGFLGLTAIAILAGFGVASLSLRWGTRSWWPALTVALVGLVTVEALRAPLSLVRYDGIPSVHRRLATPDVTGIVVFPLYGGAEFHQNARYLLHQTRHWRPMVNGYSSFAPQSFFDRVARLQKFPAPETLLELRSIGVSHVVLYKPPLEQNFGREVVASLRAHPDFEFVIDQDGFAIYRLLGGAKAPPLR